MSPVLIFSMVMILAFEKEWSGSDAPEIHLAGQHRLRVETLGMRLPI